MPLSIRKQSPHDFGVALDGQQCARAGASGMLRCLFQSRNVVIGKWSASANSAARGAKTYAGTGALRATW
jgi:hypothetical protein